MSVGPLVGGIVAILIGVVIIVFRVRLAGLNARGNRNFLGEIGKEVARKSTPIWVAVPGVAFILVGISAIFFAFP